VGYNTIALDHTIIDKLPASIVNEIPDPLPFKVPTSLHILRRCTLHISDPSQNHRLKSLAPAYDILALRPVNKKALELQRGIKFEVCYAPGILNSDGGASRRNLISNATQIIRATRGRGLIISSEAKRALACRGPADVTNMAVLWGLGQERGTEAVGREARSVVVQAKMKRTSFRGVIDVVYGGEKPGRPIQEGNHAKDKQQKGKRKAAAMEVGAEADTISPQPMSKRERKRQAKKARLENATAQEKENMCTSENVSKEASDGNEGLKAIANGGAS